MHKFLRLSLTLLFLTSLGCEKIPEKGDEDANARFYDVVYQVESTRENNSFAWVPVQGIYRLKITQSSDTEGTFIFYYANYDEPQFVVGLCSGGVKGNISVIDTTTTSTPDSTVYDPNGSYNSGPTAGTTVDLTDPDDPNKTISPIFQYNFQLAINFRNLDPTCRSESDRSVSLFRFANGQVIMVNEYRELKLNPVLVGIE